MTLADERYRAVNSAREFLRSLLDPKKTPKVPRKVRQQAYSVLKHYIWEMDLEKLAKKCPDILKKG
jgi:hypothetical protein